MTWPLPPNYKTKPEDFLPSLENLMKQGVTRVLKGREITLGYTDEQKRIGWVWKDTGLPASIEDTHDT
jgi:hypothetical protein